MQRTLSAALTMLLALGSWAHAQGPGTIYFTEEASATARYFAVRGDGSNPTLLPIPANALPSGRSDYPGGRLFQVAEAAGTIPGGTEEYADLVARDLSGGRVRLTAFSGPAYVRAGDAKGWSNDNQDSFFCFTAYDPTGDLCYVYRAHVTGADIVAAGFVPLTPGDARLEVVLVLNQKYISFLAWSGDGARMAYADSYSLNGTTYGRLRVHAAGPDTSAAGDQVLNDSRLTNLLIGNGIDYSPVTNQVVVWAHDMNVSKGKTGPMGVALYTWNGGGWAFSWLQQNYQTNSSGLQYGYYPQFSPDGNAVAFSGKYYRNKLWKAAVLKCSVTGGPFYVVTDAPTETNNLRRIFGWRW